MLYFRQQIMMWNLRELLSRNFSSHFFAHSRFLFKFKCNKNQENLNIILVLHAYNVGRQIFHRWTCLIFFAEAHLLPGSLNSLQHPTRRWTILTFLSRNLHFHAIAVVNLQLCLCWTMYSSSVTLVDIYIHLPKHWAHVKSFDSNKNIIKL